MGYNVDYLLSRNTVGFSFIIQLRFDLIEEKMHEQKYYL